MRIAVLHDAVAAHAKAPPDVTGVLEAVDAVQVALRDLGHVPIRVPVGASPGAWLGRLEDADVELVFNLCEGVGGHSASEARVVALVELIGLPITGSGSETLALARRKDRVNAVLSAEGLPVPAWARVRADGPPLRGWTRYPAIVKPAGEDASIGISQASVVRNEAELADALAAAARLGPLLVQEFLGGRELNVGIVGETVLPVAEIDFTDLPAGFWPIVDYRAKWEPGSDEDRGTRPRCPAPLDPAMLRGAVDLALAAWTAIEGRGYGRVDLRADEHGRLHILEVNPNPDLAPSAGLSRMAAANGWGYVDLIGHIVREASA